MGGGKWDSPPPFTDLPHFPLDIFIGFPVLILKACNCYCFFLDLVEQALLLGSTIVTIYMVTALNETKMSWETAAGLECGGLFNIMLSFWGQILKTLPAPLPPTESCTWAFLAIVFILWNSLLEEDTPPFLTGIQEM